MTPDISVIIPLYNARAYICHAIDSLLGQTMRELEILVVDDCSTDGSPELVEGRYGQEERVRLIRQKHNGGPGVARNTGIGLARGRYIAFCDSDDQVMPDCYETMYRVALSHDADVVHASGCIVPMVEETPGDMRTVPDADWAAICLDNPEVTGPTPVTGAAGEILERWLAHSYHWAIWNKLYRREFLLAHGIRFGKMRLAEDQQFCFNCLFHAKTYVQLPGYWYCYRQTPGSACHSGSSVKSLVRALNAVREVEEAMAACTADLACFREHPEWLRQATDYVTNALDVVFITPAYAELGEEKIRASREVAELFRDAYGESAGEAEEAFHNAHRGKTPVPSIMDVMCDPARLRALCAQGRFMTREQKLRELAGQ